MPSSRHLPVVGLHMQVYIRICRYSLLAAVLVVVGEAVVLVELKAAGAVLPDVVVVAGVVLTVPPYFVVGDGSGV